MSKSMFIALCLSAIAIMLVAASCKPEQPPAQRVYPDKVSEVQELTQVDILDMIDKDLLNSSFISVRGVRLGDDAERVVSLLGRPAGYESPEAGILNMRFEDPLTNETELIVHLEDDSVARIAVKLGIEDELVNRSRFNMTKEQATYAFGKPDVAYDTKFYHIYEYDDHGFEIYFKARRMEGYGFVPPK